MTGKAVQEYVYSFKQGNKTVQGLTLEGINEAANRRGGIEVSEQECTETEDSFRATVKATDTVLNSSRYGAYEQPKKMGNKTDPFAFTKAIHKAQRNAIKQLLPVPIIKEVLNFYLNGGKEESQSAKTSQKKPSGSKSATSSSPPNNNDQKACFAILEEMKDDLKDKGFSVNDVWNFIKDRYNVETRKDITEKQYAEIRAQLQTAKDNDAFFDKLTGALKKGNGSEESNESKPSNGSGSDLNESKKKVQTTFEKLESELKPLTKEDCLKLGAEKHGQIKSWTIDTFIQFATDLEEWKSNYIGVAKDEKINTNSEQDILDEVDSI